MIFKLLNIKALLFIFLFVIYFIYFCVCFNLNWFNFHHDTVIYGTSVIKSYLSDTYQFFLYSHIFLRDGNWEFHTHGFLYQFFFGKLLSCQTWQGLFVATYAVYLIFYLPLSLFLIKKNTSIYTAFLALFIYIVTSIYLVGRPESLLLPLSVLFLYLSTFGINLFILSGIFTGFSFAVSPACAVIAFLSSFYYLGSTKQNLFLNWFNLGLSTFISFLTLYFISFHNLNVYSLISNIAKVKLMAPSAIGQIIPSFGLSLNSIPCGMFFCYSAVFSILFFHKSKYFIFFILFCFFSISYVNSAQIYNYCIFFIPSIYITDKYVNKSNFKLIVEYVYPAICFVCLAVLMVSCFRYFLILYSYSECKLKFKNTAMLIDDIKNNDNSKGNAIGFLWISRPSFSIFFSPNDYAFSINSLDDTDTLHELEKYNIYLNFIIVPNSGSVTKIPESILGDEFVLRFSNQNREKLTFLNFKMGGWIPDYSFSLYSRR